VAALEDKDVFRPEINFEAVFYSSRAIPSYIIRKRG